ncbi:hypothetical protein [Flavobacterium pedocola]
MTIITYTKELSVSRIGVGCIFLILGIFGLLMGNISSIIMTCLGLYMFVSEGAEINLTDKTYRTVKSFLGVKVGNWKPIPDFEYVSVFRTSETERVNGVAATAAVTNAVIILNLFYNTSRHITFYKTKDRNDAFEVAKHISFALGIDILDATEREKKWL